MIGDAERMSLSQAKGSISIRWQEARNYALRYAKTASIPVAAKAGAWNE